MVTMTMWTATLVFAQFAAHCRLSVSGLFVNILDGLSSSRLWNI